MLERLRSRGQKLVKYAVILILVGMLIFTVLLALTPEIGYTVRSIIDHFLTGQ